MHRSPTQNYARQLKVADQIEFRTWAPRNAVRDTMGQADVFLLPNFEGGGMVVLVVFAAGLPVVCLDYGGPGAMMTPGGVAVAAVSQGDTVAALTTALTRYAANPAPRP